MTAQPNRFRDIAWHKSSASGGASECVEVTSRPSSVLVRDSADRPGPVLEFTAAQWRGFVRRVKSERQYRL